MNKTVTVTLDQHDICVIHAALYTAMIALDSAIKTDPVTGDDVLDDALKTAYRHIDDIHTQIHGREIPLNKKEKEAAKKLRQMGLRAAKKGQSRDYSGESKTIKEGPMARLLHPKVSKKGRKA
jgi:hypothetical protein